MSIKELLIFSRLEFSSSRSKNTGLLCEVKGAMSNFDILRPRYFTENDWVPSGLLPV